MKYNKNVNITNTNSNYILYSVANYKPYIINSVNEIVNKFIDISIQCCSDGFKVNTFNDENKLLAYALQSTCENEIMQFNLKSHEKKDEESK